MLWPHAAERIRPAKAHARVTGRERTVMELNIGAPHGVRGYTASLFVLAQLSFSVTARLNTGAAGVESGSTAK